MDWYFLAQFLIGIFSVFLVLSFFRSRKVANFGEKYILVTGSDSGFGKLAVIRLDQLGFHVFAGCFTEDGERGLKEACSKRVITIRLDVTDYSNVEQVYSTICSHLSENTGLWGVINNAGAFNPGYLEWHSRESFRRMVDVNMWGVVDVTMKFLPLIRKARGRIVNVSSAAGYVALPGYGPYCITKFAVEAFSDALRREMMPWGINVCTIQPGGHRTEMTNGNNITSSLDKVWEKVPGDIKDEYGETFFSNVKAGYYEWTEGLSKATDQVIDAFVDALTSRWPRARYKVGVDALLFAFVVKLPDAIEDWLVRKLFFMSQITSKFSKSH